MEQQVCGESSERYIIREGVAAWSNRFKERVVTLHYQGGSGCMEQQVQGESS
jgi:hypothetical protein